MYASDDWDDGLSEPYQLVPTQFLEGEDEGDVGGVEEVESLPDYITGGKSPILERQTTRDREGKREDAQEVPAYLSGIQLGNEPQEELPAYLKAGSLELRKETKEDNSQKKKEAEEEGKEEKEEDNAFECNICFELLEQPVVTSCGHLYCWKCIYQVRTLLPEKNRV